MTSSTVFQYLVSALKPLALQLLPLVKNSATPCPITPRWLLTLADNTLANNTQTNNSLVNYTLVNNTLDNSTLTNNALVNNTLDNNSLDNSTLDNLLDNNTLTNTSSTTSGMSTVQTFVSEEQHLALFNSGGGGQICPHHHIFAYTRVCMRIHRLFLDALAIKPHQWIEFSHFFQIAKITTESISEGLCQYYKYQC